MSPLQAGERVSLLEEIPVRRHAHGRGEQMREMVWAHARNSGDRCKPQIIGEMRVDEIDRAAQARIESNRAPPTVETRLGESGDKPRQKGDREPVDIGSSQLVAPLKRRCDGMNQRRYARLGRIKRILQLDP